MYRIMILDMLLKKTLGTGRYFGTLVCAMEQKVQSHNYWLKELQMNRTQADQKNS